MVMPCHHGDVKLIEGSRFLWCPICGSLCAIDEEPVHLVRPGIIMIPDAKSFIRPVENLRGRYIPKIDKPEPGSAR